MKPIAVNPAALPAPSGYSHGTLQGNTLYLGGQTALDANMRIGRRTRQTNRHAVVQNSPHASRVLGRLGRRILARRRVINGQGTRAVLIRGEPEKLAQLRGTEEFGRLNLRAGFAVDGFGVVSALLDDEAAKFVTTANDLTADLR